MRTEITKLHQRLQTTFIYVTHDQTEAMTLGTRIVVMKDGVIQQVDSPVNLYNRPNNMFVAGFIGSPQMNMMEAEIKKSGEDVMLVVGQYEIKLVDAKAKLVEDGGYVGKTVIMGIRPEDLSDEEMAIAAAGPGAVVEAEVEVTELLGAEVFLYLSLAGQPITARVNPRSTAKTNDRIKIALDINKIHLFDKDTEQTITN
jgi:multiple sugar transport system ATP-binding protein